MSFLQAPPKPKDEAQEEGNPDPFGLWDALGMGNKKRKNSDANFDVEAPPEQKPAQHVVQPQAQVPTGVGTIKPTAKFPQGVGLPAVLPNQAGQVTLSAEQRQAIQENINAMQGISEEQLSKLSPIQQDIYKQRMSELQQRIQQRTGGAGDVVAAIAPSEDMLLIAAIRSGDIRRIAELLLDMKKSTDYKARHETETMAYPLLHWAVLDDQVAVARFLLHGEVATNDEESFPKLPNGTFTADVKERTHRNETALHWAALRGHIRSCHFLLENGIDLRAVDEKGYNALHRAAQQGQVHIVALLNRRGLDLDEKDNDGRTALHWAAYQGEDMTAQWLIDHEANIMAEDHEKCLPIHWAALKGNAKMVRLLVKEGAPEQLFLKDVTNGDPEMLAQGKLAKAEPGSFPAQQFKRTADFLAKAKKAKGDPDHRSFKIPHFSWFFWPLLSPLVWYLYYTRVFPLTSYQSLLTLCIWIGFWGKWIMWIRLQLKDPGYLVTRKEPNRKQTKYAAVSGQQETAISMDDGNDTRVTLPSTNIQGASRYRELYDNALDRGLDVPVCTTCEIVKPLRSKHDRVTNRCVAKFDHYCPWMNVAIGQNNYLEFFFSMFFAMVAIWAWIFLMISYTWNVNTEKTWFANFWDNLWFELFAWFFLLIGLYAIAMVYQHMMLIRMNLSTNEMMNRHRYRYLATGNPFDQGALGNFAEFLGFQKPVSLDVKDFYKGEFEGMSAREAEAQFVKEMQQQGFQVGNKKPSQCSHNHGGAQGSHGHSH